ncbi:hypothetical protein F4778DRAFT_753087 [Xylariomycetidae sp. FL2044]|nr:hypothetical protein F4778DRAFT_753087 [Xylariomycetidae sp. FL2044]
MASGPIRLNLARESDRAEEKLIKNELDRLVNGEASPEVVAKFIDETVTAECEAALATYNKFKESRNGATLTNVEQSDINEKVPGPSPVDWEYWLRDTLAPASFVIPADHPGHGRVVSMLQALKRIPVHSVPRLTPDGRLGEYGLWKLDREHDEIFVGDLRSFCDDNWHRCRGVRDDDTGAPDKRLVRYQNYSSFVAQLFAAGLTDTMRLSALAADEFYLLYGKYREPRRREPWVMAGAQWLIHAAPALYDMCEKRAWTAARPLNPKLWGEWKRRFNLVVADGSGFSTEAVELASQALEHMALAEKTPFEGPSMVEHYGYPCREPPSESEGSDGDTHVIEFPS